MPLAQQERQGHHYGTVIVHPGGTAHLGDYIAGSPQQDVAAHRKQHFLRSLEYPSMMSRMNAISKPWSQTFEWLFDETRIPAGWDSFVDWLKSGTGIYLVEGKPGSGKSTLMKFIATHQMIDGCLADNNTQEPPIRLAHYFWLAGSPEQRSIRGMLASLAHQLVLSLPDSLFNASDALVNWPLHALNDLFLNLLNATKRNVFILVDALDEIDQNEMPSELMKKLNCFANMQHVRICVSSRPLFWLDSQAALTKRLRLHELTRQDICDYALQVLDEEFSFYDSELKDHLEDLVELISNKAEGVFLWVKYALHSLSQEIASLGDIQDLKNNLECLPSEMEDLFRVTWKRHENSNEKHRAEAADFLFCGSFPHITQNYCDLNLFRVAVMADQRLYAHYSKTWSRTSLKLIVAACRDTKRKLTLRTAGLLMCYANSPYNLNEYEQNMPLLRVGYIHRTVHDFLVCTPFGQSISSIGVEKRLQLCTRYVIASLATFIEGLRPLELTGITWVVRFIREQLKDEYKFYCLVDRVGQHIQSQRHERHLLPYNWLYGAQLANSGSTLAEHNDFVALLISCGAWRSAQRFVIERNPSGAYRSYLLCRLLLRLYSINYDADQERFVPSSVLEVVTRSTEDCRPRHLAVHSERDFAHWLCASGADVHELILVPVCIDSHRRYHTFCLTSLQLCLTKAIGAYYKQTWISFREAVSDLRVMVNMVPTDTIVPAVIRDFQDAAMTFGTQGRHWPQFKWSVLVGCCFAIHSVTRAFEVLSKLTVTNPDYIPASHEILVDSIADIKFVSLSEKGLTSKKLEVYLGKLHYLPDNDLKQKFRARLAKTSAPHSEVYRDGSSIVSPEEFVEWKDACAGQQPGELSTSLKEFGYATEEQLAEMKPPNIDDNLQKEPLPIESWYEDESIPTVTD